MPKKGWILSLVRVTKKKHRTIKPDDIIAFFQQLSTLLNSGTTLLHALRLSADQCESEKLTKILRDISNKVAGGTSFHVATAEYPKIFKTHWSQIIHTGEITGQLGPLMTHLANYIQQVRKTQGKVTSAMIYPLILLGMVVVSTFIMLWKVVPTFAEFFEDFGSKLPAITEMVIGMSDLIKERGLVVVLCVGGCIFGFNAYIKTTGGKRNFDAALLALPVFGDLLVQSAMEKFAVNFSLLLKSGTPLLESIRTVQEVFKDNTVYYDALAGIYGNVSRGSGIAASLETTELFTAMILNMTRMGEESGKLSEVLEQAASYYRDKVDTTITRVTGLIEPIIVIIMGVVFAGLLASIYIPMFSLASGPR